MFGSAEFQDGDLMLQTQVIAARAPQGHITALQPIKAANHAPWEPIAQT
jgi:hypothetical protein